MNRKWSFLGKRRFYKLEQAMELLTNMSDCEDESTSESENEGVSSDSSEDAPEEHQVRTDSNILMPKETEASKAKEIPNKGKKAAPKLVGNQSATNCALLADQTATTLGASPAKVSKVSKAKEIPNKGKKATPKLVGNQSATNCALLADQTATTLGASPAKVSKVSKAKEIPNKGKKAAPKLVGNQSATNCALLADQTATTLGASPAKVSKVSKAKENPTRAKKLHQNWLVIRVPQSMLYWLIKQPPHQVRNMLLHLQKYLKYLKPKKYPKRAKKLHQNWLIIRVPQSMLYWLIKQPPHQVRNMLLHLQKYLKPNKYPAKKLHQSWLIIRVLQRPWHPIVIWM